MCVCSCVLVCITNNTTNPKSKWKKSSELYLNIIFMVPIIWNLEKFSVFFSSIHIYGAVLECLSHQLGSEYTNLHTFSLIIRNDILVSKLFQAPKACHMSFCFPDTQARIHILDICISSLEIESLTSIPDQQYCLHILL